MSLLSRAKMSSRGSHYSITALQQFNFYATRATPSTPKTRQSTRTPKPSQPPSSPEVTKNPAAQSMRLWPKPIEIPYQEKVENRVSLIGSVKTPVQFDPAGNSFAAAVVSREYGGNTCVSIPVVFEGDLAHVVATHVKENDRVLISGKLGAGPIRFSFSDGLGNHHIVAENLNFVTGFAKHASGKKTAVETPLAEEKPEEMVENDEEFNQKWEQALENAKAQKLSGGSDWASGSVAKQPEQENGKSLVESAKMKKTGAALDLWRDLLRSPEDWWDYRGHKSQGLVKVKYPDFKHKQSDESLWVNSAPDWVLPGIGQLEFDVKFMKQKPASVGEGFGEKKEFGKAKQGGKGQEESWKDLVENPSNWWDNRVGKKHPRGPDFKHKESDVALWVSSAPDWVLPRIGQLEFVKPKPASAGEGLGDKKDFGKAMQGGKGGEESWKDLVENPSNWWDNRVGKKHPRGPDFKHKETGVALWLSNSPSWVISRLPDGKKDVEAL